MSVRDALLARIEGLVAEAAATSPALMGPVWRALLAEVGRHESFPTGDHVEHHAVWRCGACGEHVGHADCPSVLRWAAALGVGGDGGEFDKALAAAVDAAINKWRNDPRHRGLPRLHEFIADALLSGPLAPAAPGGDGEGLPEEVREAARAAARGATYDAPERVRERCADAAAEVAWRAARPALGGDERGAVERLRALVEKAVPGPWVTEYDSCDCGDGYGCSHGSWVHALRLPVPHTELSGNEVLDSYKYGYSEMSEFPPDTVEFIAACRDDVPLLLASVERLTAARDQP